MIELTKKNLPIPEHLEGTQKHIQDSIVFESREEAKAYYIEAKNRLLKINHWCGLCTEAGAMFELTDEKGMRSDEAIQKGCHIKIDVPGPGAGFGKGYDWARVEAINEKSDIASDVEPKFCSSVSRWDSMAVLYFQ